MQWRLRALYWPREFFICVAELPQYVHHVIPEIHISLEKYFLLSVSINYLLQNDPFAWLYDAQAMSNLYRAEDNFDKLTLTVLDNKNKLDSIILIRA